MSKIYKLKTINNPIKTEVSFKMDEKGRWLVKYKFERSTTIYEPLFKRTMTRKLWRILDYEVNRICEEDGNFLILPESYFPHSYLPQLVFPKTIMKGTK